MAKSTKGPGLQPAGYMVLGVLAFIVGLAILSDGSAVGGLVCLGGVALVIVGIVAMGVRVGRRD